MTNHAGGPSNALISRAIALALEGVLPSAPYPVDAIVPAASEPHDLKYMNPIFVRLIVLNRLNAGIEVTNSPAPAPTNGAITVPNGVVKLDGTEVFNMFGPVPGTVFESQADAVIRAKDLRSDRMPEIVEQQSDVLSFYGGLLQLNGISQPWVLELLHSVLEAAMSVVAQIKYAIPFPRPVDLMRDAAPIIQTPQHSTMPSGHAAEGYAAAYVLSRLAGNSDAETITELNLFLRMAARIAVNRTVAGVHFPMDSMAGACLGITLGRIYAGKFGIPDSPATAGGFVIDATLFGNQDFNEAEFSIVANTTAGAPNAFDWLTRTAALTFPSSNSDLEYLRIKSEEELVQ
jgi:hypothetical protein